MHATAAHTAPHGPPRGSRPLGRLDDNLARGTTTYVDAATRGFRRRRRSPASGELPEWLLTTGAAALASLSLGLLILQLV